MNNTTQALNRRVADFGVLFVKLHNYHWLVTGPHFHQLHALFETLYDEVAERLDEVAERILQLGGVPFATLKEFLAQTSIPEARGNETPTEMVNQTIYDFTTVNEAVREAIRTAQTDGDEVTADLLVGISKSFEKHLWMLGALEK
ncbi:MAG: DNA starvation/stationary phase protection protein [Candidatus Izemoplasmatales bacterium]